MLSTPPWWQVLAYGAIAYPLSVSWALTLFHHNQCLTEAHSIGKPKLLLMGTQDNFTGIAKFHSGVGSFGSPMEVVVVQGADHFFFGKEAVVCRAVHDWLQKVRSWGWRESMVVDGGPLRVDAFTSTSSISRSGGGGGG